MAAAFPRDFSLLLAERVREQSASVCAPGELRISKTGERHRVRVQPVDGRCERGPAVVRVEVAGELEDGRIVDRRLAMQLAARGEDEQRAANRSVQLLICHRNLLAGDVREDYEIDVTRRLGTRLRSSRA